jgi:aminoglycoside phosphotransferase (APT) family kinase protein
VTRGGPARLDPGLLAGLAAIAGSVGGDGSPEVLSERPDGVVIRAGGVVVKAHAAGTDPAALASRLRVAASAAATGVLLAPLPIPAAAAPVPGAVTPAGTLLAASGGRLVTAWPAGEPVDPDDRDAAPWEQAARLLARLHDPAPAVAAGQSLPPAGGPARVARAMARLGAADGPAARAVRAAFALLPPWVRDPAPAAPRPDGAIESRSRTPGVRVRRPATPHRDPAQRRYMTGSLTHGDWHLGQVVRVPGARGWLLIDVDDLGVGDPAWDLARPAAWFAAGLLPAEVWARFLSAYRAAGGAALPPAGDPWPALDLPARALAVQSAALAVAAAARTDRPLDEIETALVDACRRIVDLAGRA